MTYATGTVDYFGVMDVPIDVKAICRDASDGGTAFNNPSSVPAAGTEDRYAKSLNQESLLDEY